MDLAGNTAASTGSSTTFIVDNRFPTASLSSPALNPTSLSAIPIIVTFSEPVDLFTEDSIVVTNATVENFAGSGATYTFDLATSVPGDINVTILGGSAFDVAGNANLASTPLVRIYDPSAPNPDIVEDGHVDAVDVQLVINKALGIAIDGDADVNHDTQIDALDVQLVINFALNVG